MDLLKILLVLALSSSSKQFGSACQIEGVISGLIPVEIEVTDVFSGVFYHRTTTNILGINDFSMGEGLVQGPYVVVSHNNNEFTISTNNNYPNYEEYETMQTMTVTVEFNCAGGSNSAYVFMIHIKDTNNNAPQFRPQEEFEFVIAPPLPPNFSITGCESSIIVRDIDLTTQRIEFAIEDNPYFQITYDSASSTTSKEFRARLSTTTYIRSFSEEITLRISATDVDLTGDPPLTSYGTIRIQGDNSFELPEDMIFGETFYLGNYSRNDQVALRQAISLEHGYDELVKFTLEGEYANNFNLVGDSNSWSLIVSQPLPADVVGVENQIYLVVKAERELITASSATIVLDLPEDIPLQFEQPHYEGTIENGTLYISELTLSQGYEGHTISLEIENEFSSYFSANIDGNVITVSMTDINQNIIDDNSFIKLHVIASTDRSSAVAVVFLEIIKDDNVTPLFEKNFYAGTYTPETGLVLEQIEIVQGYDDSVSVELGGDYSTYFSISQNGRIINLVTSEIPQEIFVEQTLLILVEATKPRTVGSTAFVSISLPQARELGFSASFYKGSIQDSSLSHDAILLNTGYDSDVNFTLNGDFSDYFSITNNQNNVNIILSGQIPDNVIQENNFLTLLLTATGSHAVSTSASIVLDIIKNDITTPLFTKNVYYGAIEEGKIEIENITLAQGYDDTVLFMLDGELSHFFVIKQSGNNAEIITLSDIPEELIFAEKAFVFSILAEKSLTVGGRASIFIKFPEELTNLEVMTFESSTFVGSYMNNTLSIENITLDSGYKFGTQFKLNGEYASYFTLNNVNNIATISIPNALPIEVLENNKFLILEVEASRNRAVSVSASVLIEIIEREVVQPAFSESYYKGVYTVEEGLEIGVITLEGYDDTTTFELEGEFKEWFTLEEDGNSVILISGDLPEEVVGGNTYLILSIIGKKQNALSARSTIIIDLPKEMRDPAILRFEQKSYVGKIENNQLQLATLNLYEDYNVTLQFNLTGELASYFEILESPYSISIELREPIPTEITQQIDFIVLDVAVEHSDSISGHATVILDVVKDLVTLTPIFELPFYTGEYSVQDGLVFTSYIQLSQGFEETVLFTLEGDDSEWFSIVENGQNNLTISLKNASLEINEKTLYTFSVVANNVDGLTGKTAIIISFTPSSLAFSEQYYVGSLGGTNLTLNQITLVETPAGDVQVNLIGEFKEYFTLSYQNGVFTLQLQSELPAEITNEVNLLLFTLEARDGSAKSEAIVIIELMDEVARLTFEETYYVGMYSEINGLSFEQQLNLQSGFDETVQFRLNGDDAQWFEVNQTLTGVSIILSSPIPHSVLENNQHLIFTITAEKPYYEPTVATVLISLEKDNSTLVLSFERINYIGSIENDATSLEPIRLSEAMENVTFNLFGDLQEFFEIVNEEDVIKIEIVTPLPTNMIPENDIVVLDMQASVPGAIPAYTTIIFRIIKAEISPIIFEEIYYTGSYHETNGFTFDRNMTLTEGYDETVTFNLEGDGYQYFNLTKVENTVKLELNERLPESLIEYEHQLIFVLYAKKPGFESGKATIIISLLKENETKWLNFQRNHYLGTVANNVSVIDAMVLTSSNNDFSQISLALNGDLSDYFSATREESIVTVTLKNTIPNNLIPDNLLTVLDLEAYATDFKSAVTTIIFDIIQERIVPDVDDMLFSDNYYMGQYSEAKGFVFNSSIFLSEGYDTNVTFDLDGDSSQWFGLTVNDNSATIVLSMPIPPGVLVSNHQLVFFVTASKPGSITAKSTIVISVIEDYVETKILSFERVTYSGFLNFTSIDIEAITLSGGYPENISFSLFGVLADNFETIQDGPIIRVILETPLTVSELEENKIIVLELQASAPEFIPAHTTIVLEILNDKVLDYMEFDAAYYTAQYSHEDGITMDYVISLSHGYDDEVILDLEGETSIWFSLQKVSDNAYNVTLNNAIPPAIISNNKRLIFTVTAQKSDSFKARATVIVALIQEFKETDTLLGFEKVSYVGTIANNTSNLEPIILSGGYSENVTFNLHGAMYTYFSLSSSSATVTVTLQTPIPEEFMMVNNMVVLEIEAIATDAIAAHATIIFEIVKEIKEVMVFERTYYNGNYNEIDGLIFNDAIVLVEGYDENVNFSLNGDYASLFRMVQTENSVAIFLNTTLPEDITQDLSQIVFVIAAEKPNAAIARATIIISLDIKQTDLTILAFEKNTYSGTLDGSVVILDPILVTEGSSLNVSYQLQGELSSYFGLTYNGPFINIILEEDIPEELIPKNLIVIIGLEASAFKALPAYTTIVFEVLKENNEALFDKVLYYGSIQGIEVQHETITLEGYTGTVNVVGDYEAIFTASLMNKIVSISVTGNLVLPINETTIALELNASGAKAVLILTIENAETAKPPVITFSSDSYTLQAHVDQIGIIGQVSASTDTGESVTYSLDVNNEHLLQRISINQNGQINLSAPTNNGTYDFNVEATTIITKISKSSSVILTVNDDVVCIPNDKGLSPLIIIDKDEEEPHRNLVTFNTDNFPGCQYNMINRWPTNQSWLYIDEIGLHSTAIDREDPSIAFMPLSQVQVELVLQCESDDLRHKRSVDNESITNLLGTYDYGGNKWLLTDEIEFNPRRSLVNLIVNDVNDNAPIFDGIENAPLVVGYPTPELEETIRPRSLAELKATDADVGENAVILYRTDESVIAVSPTTGFVHVRNNVRLEDKMRLVVHATDRFGEGLTGSIQLEVKLVDSRHIVVVTVRDAFLDDENTILENLSTSVGYEVKALRSMIVTADVQSSDGQTKSRIKRETSNDVGTSMMIFVYGLVDREPVSVEQLKNDISSITSAAVSVVNTVSLEDHLEGREICDISGRDTGLLVSTIVLSVLLFIVLVGIGLWFFLKWWRKRKYNQFTDEKSLQSAIESVEEIQKPESVIKPRLNIDELLRSEKRLQEMLDAPVQDISVEPISPVREPDYTPEIQPPPLQPHVVIQSIDKLKPAEGDSDEDEFGEQKTPRRKSVVTFNENVEKIIHVEDDPDDSSDYEVYKL